MAFTAKLIDAIKRDGGWKITVEFTDGADVRVEAYRFTGSTTKELKAFVRRQAGQLADIKTADFSAHVGKVMDLTIAPPVTTPPTAEEIAKDAWFDDWGKLDKLVRLANNGLIQPDDTRITALQASLILGWINSYLGDL